MDQHSTTIVDITKSHFARHGIPLRCITDNGPQFVSNEYKEFAQTYGFEHITSSPYWSRSNSKAEAEAAVNDTKSTLKKSHNVYLVLLNIRNTPPCGYSFSPAQRLMGRRTRSTLPLSEDQLKPEPADPLTVCSEITLRRKASKAQYDKYAQPPLMPLPLGSQAYAKPRPSQRGAPWLYGRVIDNPSPRSYNIDTGNVILRRNRAQLRPAAPPTFPTRNMLRAGVVIRATKNRNLLFWTCVRFTIEYSTQRKSEDFNSCTQFFFESSTIVKLEKNTIISEKVRYWFYKSFIVTLLSR